MLWGKVSLAYLLDLLLFSFYAINADLISQ